MKKEEKNKAIKHYIVKGLGRKTHEVKDAIQRIFFYLGLVETVGNNFSNVLIMLVVANGIDFHVEYSHTTPRIKHVMSIKDLERPGEFVSLKTKLNFLQDNGMNQIVSVINSDLRNKIAHSDFEIKDNSICIKGKPAAELALENSFKLLTATNEVSHILQKNERRKRNSEKIKREM